ncbi:DMT family transporter [soil metagenome]
MNPVAFGLAFGAAILHASWNMVVKDSSDRLLNMWAIIFLPGCVCIPLALVVRPDIGAIAVMVAVSAMVHTTNDMLMARAYDLVDLSVAYPLARGFSPALIAVGGVWLLGDALSAAAVVGIVLVAGGIVSLATGQFDPRGVTVALTAAVAVASYTLLDGAGVRTLGSAPAFITVSFPAHAALMTIVTLKLRGPAAMGAFLRRERNRVAGTAVAAPASYVLVLLAIERAPIGLVSAIRETSLVIAAILGVIVLKERLTRRRISAAVVITFGAVTLALN